MKKIIILATALFAISSMSFADESITKRQQLMKQLGGIGKQLGDGVDVATANKLGADIQRIAAELKVSFPKGTSEDEIKNPPTGAKAKIWAENDKFMAIFNKMAEHGVKFAAAKTADDVSATAKVFGAETCKACHDSYRTKLN